MNEIDAVLKTFYFSLCDIAKWIFAIKMLNEVIKNGNNNDLEGTIKSIINGALSYACIYSIVSILESVQSKFN
ncbi:MAG TPA: hypothetical protein VHQ24_15290 [Lachnospiraceae bacterium]|nr:hypothetical protein [Lachnospiraceae bacterium]